VVVDGVVVSVSSPVLNSVLFCSDDYYNAAFVSVCNP
jgi:hypothetical protein